MEEVYNYIEKNIKLTPRDIVVAGISGGPDSMCLLYILNEFRKKWGFYLVCAHINHNKRVESEQEKIDLEKYCNQNKIIFEYIKIDKWSDDNFHNEARTVRYNFFEELVNNYGAKYLMTAHHADDLMETILMRIVRGSTLKGYCGFSRKMQKDNYEVVRPLLSVTKQEIEDFDKAHNISFALDKSNDSDVYTRNRYRKVVLPFLKKEDKNVHKKFIKFSETLLENSEFIENETSKVFNKVFINGILSIEKFKALDKVIQTKIIYNILEKIYGDDLLIIGDAHVDLIFSLIDSTKANTLIHLPNNVIVNKAYDDITFSFDEDEENIYEIELNGEIELPNGKHIIFEQKSDDTSNYTTRLSSKEVTLPLYVRNRKDGDKIDVKGMIGTKKVSHVFMDNKIKQQDRDSWPVVLDANNKIVWIPGLKKSKLDKETTEEYDIVLKYY